MIDKLFNGIVPELQKPFISDDLYDLILKLTSAKASDRPGYETIMNKLGIAASKITARNDVIPQQAQYMKLADLKNKSSAALTSKASATSNNSTTTAPALKSSDNDSENTYLRKVDGVETKHTPMLTRSQANAATKQTIEPTHDYEKMENVTPKDSEYVQVQVVSKAATKEPPNQYQKTENVTSNNKDYVEPGIYVSSPVLQK